MPVDNSDLIELLVKATKPIYSRVNDGTINTQQLTSKQLILVGEAHRNAADEDLVRKLIMDWKPDYVLCEALGDLVLKTLKDKNDQMRHPDQDFYYREFTKHWIGISCEYPVPFIGMEYTKWKPNEHNSLSLKDSFIRREAHFIQMIDRYLAKGKVLAICGDTHLRTIATKQLGQVSPLYTKYCPSYTTLIIRTLHGEIE